LSGSGVITDGKLLLNHQLQADSKVENETFQISVFSDPGMGAGTQIGTTQSVAVQDTPLILGNSYYQVVNGASWSNAETNSEALGGSLTKIENQSENDFIVQQIGKTLTETAFPGRVSYIGLSDSVQEGVWKWRDGTTANWFNWAVGEPNNANGNAEEDAAIIHLDSLKYGASGVWNDVPIDYSECSDGIAEVPITASIAFTGTAKEGQTLTTTINLNAGTLSTGNLVNGATVYWSVSGITADDLTSGALTGSGVIANGKLVLTHVLKVDADTGEQFKVSVFSDAAMTQQIGTTSFAAVQEAKSVIRANSLYTVVNGPNWLQAEASSVALGGHLTCIGDQEENEFLRSRFSNDSSLKESLYRSNDPYNSYVSWIGLSYNFASGDWFDTQGNRQTYFNWFPPFKDPISTEFGAWQVSMLLSSDYPFTPGSWDDSFENQSIPYFRNGIAEVPITSGIVFSGTPKEGQTLTTTINLNAGTQTTGNLVNGATVYWSVSGITADDLTSGALTGSGVIANGKLVLTHVLKVDADTGEQFKVSVFSDAEMTQQIGTTATTTVQSVTPVLQGNSLYVVIDGPTWVKAQENAVLIGGNLASIGSASENNFIADYLNKNHEASNAIWIGLTDEVAEGDWKWTTGEALNYENWYPGEPSDSAFSQYLEDYAVIVTRANPNGDNGPVLLGQWGDDNNAGAGSFIGNGMGIAEIPITSSIVFSGTPKEGQTLTTTINLNAGTQTTGNLVNGATVYWSVSGITAEDLTSGALTGSGVIANGTLVLTHGLKVDADTGEQFKVSVFSDAEMTQQIGTTASTAIQESDNTAPTVTNILVQGTTVILKCSEAVSATSVPTTTFKVETISGSTVTTRTISQVALDQNDATKVILTLTGTAPLSSVNLRVSYTDPAGDQGTGVIQDLAGNDLGTTPTPNQYQFADTFLSGSNATIASEYKTLNLTGGTAINGTGNALANAIVGNSAKNVITGGLNADILTGLGNADTFKFALADSRLSAMDRITDLVIGTDSIDGPSSCSAANLIEFGSVASLAEADIASVLNQNVFASNRAATFTYGSGASQQTFLVLNNGTKGFQSAGDAIIEITGFQGQLTNLAVI
jgi:hypothetical protein